MEMTDLVLSEHRKEVDEVQKTAIKSTVVKNKASIFVYVVFLLLYIFNDFKIFLFVCLLTMSIYMCILNKIFSSNSIVHQYSTALKIIDGQNNYPSTAVFRSCMYMDCPHFHDNCSMWIIICRLRPK